MIWLFYFLGFYIFLGAILYLLQDRLLFHPVKLPQSFQYHYRASFREHFIQVDALTKINALYFQVPDSLGVVFYFKGNTKNIKGWAKFAPDFLRQGYDFLIMDYPGFGKSTGRRSENNIHIDTQAVYNWLKLKVPEKQIVIYGRSLGCGFAAHLAAHNQPAMLILDSPYYSMRRLAQHYTWIFPLSAILSYEMPVADYIRQMKLPVYLIHGNRDKLIPYKFSRQLLEANPQKCVLFTIQGARHNNLPTFEEYHRVLHQILRPPFTS
ncbi:MAG TPA: alpha/beta hydrolase [Microscillaceae bacterium]|nr:alpha/beta hydrolase [Microscillaceae bacterium]